MPTSLSDALVRPEHRAARVLAVLLLCLGTLVSLGAARAAAAVSLNPARDTPVRSLEFKPDPANVGQRKDWQKPGEAKGWRKVAIPHILDARVTKAAKNGTYGWYRMRFRTPRTARAFQVTFDQIRRNSTVWLNGRRVAEHEDPYTPFTVPLRDLKPGKANQLIVRAENHDTDTNEGWWNWGGIVRPVTVEPVGAVAANDLHVAGNLPCPDCSAEVEGHTLLRNRTNRTVTPQVRVQVRTGGGETETHTVSTGPLPRNGARSVRFKFPVSGVSTWAPGNPALYQATVSTVVGGAPQHVQSERIGFRSVVVSGGKLLLNGRALQMRGVSIHEDAPGHGAALTDADVAKIVADVRAIGANVVRAHYAFDQRLLNAFDREGILVYNEAPVYQADRSLRTPRFRARAIKRVLDTVQQGYSHPSVIVNSVANELTLIPDAVPGTKAFLSQAANAVRGSDDTRPVGVDLRALPGYDFSTVYAAYDVLGFNVYFGWYKGRPGHSLDPLEALEDFLRVQRETYGEQAIIATEYGPEMFEDAPEDPTVKGTHQFGIDWINRTQDILDRTPDLSGTIYWTLREFAIRPGWSGGAELINQGSLHQKGVLGYFSGAPKPAYEVLKERMSRAPLYRDEGDLAQQYLDEQRAAEEKKKREQDERRRQEEQAAAAQRSSSP